MIDNSRGGARWVGLESSNVRAACWWLDARGMPMLAVQFHRQHHGRRLPGDIYEYEGVKRELYEEFLRTESHGKFLHARIRGRFTARGPLAS